MINYKLENEKASEENEGTWQGTKMDAGAKNVAERSLNLWAGIIRLKRKRFKIM